MSAIRSKDTSPELLLRKELHRRGLRYRLHKKGLPGRPDIVFPSKRVAVFVHGCFWHNHPGCRWWKMPVTNREFWKDKFARNIARDHKNKADLLELDWKAITIWECEINRSPAAAADIVQDALRERTL